MGPFLLDRCRCCNNFFSLQGRLHLLQWWGFLLWLDILEMQQLVPHWLTSKRWQWNALNYNHLHPHETWTLWKSFELLCKHIWSEWIYDLTFATAWTDSTQDASKWGGELLHCDFAEAHAAISEVPSPFSRMRQLLGRASAQCWQVSGPNLLQNQVTFYIYKILRMCPCACVLVFINHLYIFVQACVLHIQHAYLQPPICQENAGPQPSEANCPGHFGCYGCWKDRMWSLSRPWVLP